MDEYEKGIILVYVFFEDTEIDVLCLREIVDFKKFLFEEKNYC